MVKKNFPGMHVAIGLAQRISCTRIDKEEGYFIAKQHDEAIA